MSKFFSFMCSFINWEYLKFLFYGFVKRIEFVSVFKVSSGVSTWLYRDFLSLLSFVLGVYMGEEVILIVFDLWVGLRFLGRVLF